MSKRFKWIITIAILVATVILVGGIAFHRQYKNVLMEMLIFPGGGSWVGAPVYRFIVQNNGVFVTYVGACFHTNAARSNTIVLPFARRRMRIMLSDKDFHNISEMAFNASATFATLDSLVSGQWQVVLLYGGNIYERPVIELRMIASELIRLSPLMTRYHDPRVSPNPE